MDLRLFNENYKVNLETSNNKTLPTQDIATDSSEEIKVISPNEKTITTSIGELLKGMETNKTVETLPANIIEGVQNFTYKNSNITTRLSGKRLQIQVDGQVSIKEIKLKLADLITVPTPANTSSGNGNEINGVNGEIDEKVSQGGTGDCWLLSGVLALNSTETGRQILKDSIKSNPDGSVTVTFKGVGVSYTISLDEIKRHDTDDNKSDAYSNGDNDMLVLELAVKKLKKDIALGKVKLDIDPKSWEAYNPDTGTIEGGFAQQMIYFLTGKTSTTHTAKVPRAGSGKQQTFIPEEELFKVLQDALDNGNTVLNFGLYDGIHSATQTNGNKFSIDLGNGGHALAITNITSSTVTFVNPWDSTKEYTMTWQEFAKLGIGMLSSACLDGIKVPDVDDVDNPDIEDPDIDSPDIDDPSIDIKPLKPGVDGKIYLKQGLLGYGFNEEQLNKYFDHIGELYSLKSDIKIPGVRGERGETVKTLQELLDITGLTSKNQLKEQGLTDAIIDKYFNLIHNYNSGVASYQPKDGIKYTIEQDGDAVTVKFFDVNNNQTRYIKIVDGEVIEDVATPTDIKNEHEKIKKNITSYKTLIAKGFTPELIDKYFIAINLTRDLHEESKKFIYILKNDIEVISGSGIYVTSIDELAELLKKYGVIK